MSRRRLVLLLAFAAPLAADGVLLYRDSVRSAAATLLPGDLAVGALVACYATIEGNVRMAERIAPFFIERLEPAGH
ncbi:MAG: hypothetical protein WD069_14380 [Planctomycetales bacterium]